MLAALLCFALLCGASVPARLARVRSKTPLAEQLAAARRLVGRILPAHGDDFSFEALEGEKDAFEIRGLTIRATSGVAAAAGFHYYLRSVCKASVHWGRNRTGFNVAHLPPSGQLPRVKQPIRKSTGHTFRYYFNAVTFGYSAAWWEWDRWQEEIDWAALHGINLFLALEGQEYVWEKLWLEMGVAQVDLDQYFPGPAFLAWHRMGNLDSFMGPQPPNWRRSRYELQKRLVKRMRSLGMIPVLTAFAGHIPEALEKVILTKGGKIKTHRGKSIEEGWCGFAPTTLLDASDPLFRQIGKRFLELQTEAFGTDSVYSCDTFNEMHVPFTDAASLRASSKAVIEGMMEADPDAVWLMQGWLFLFSRFWWPDRIEAYLSGVENDRMIVLDLFAEKRAMWDETESFYGKPWIWCQLLNFGGNHGLFGNMTRIAVEPARALKESPSFAGSGMSMEAIERNPVLFSMLADTVWTDEPIDIGDWLSFYIEARYHSKKKEGEMTRALLPAWMLLNASVYQFNGQLIKPPLEERPRFYASHHFQPPLEERYAPVDVLHALGIMVSAAEHGSVQPNGPFLQDVTDVGRQVLADLFTDLLLIFQTSLSISPNEPTPNDRKVLSRIRSEMLSLLDTMDAFLGANINYMLGPVLHESTRVHGKDTELQVRNILTLWGDGIVLNDYAAKEYSPMVKDYYKQRWAIFLDNVLANQVHAARTKVMDFENTWFKKSKEEADSPSGKDTVTQARAILDKYAGFTGEGYRKLSNRFPARQVQLHHAWNNQLGTLRYLCELSPHCGGFTSTGALFLPCKESALQHTKGVDAYVRLHGANSIAQEAKFLTQDDQVLSEEANRLQNEVQLGERAVSPADEVLLAERAAAVPSEVPEKRNEKLDFAVGVVIIALLVLSCIWTMRCILRICCGRMAVKKKE